MKKNTPGTPGSPTAKKPKRNTHASIAISITRFMPNLLKKKGMSKIQRVSDICDSEISIFVCCTANVSEYSGKAPKPAIKPLA